MNSLMLGGWKSRMPSGGNATRRSLRCQPRHTGGLMPLPSRLLTTFVDRVMGHFGVRLIVGSFSWAVVAQLRLARDDRVDAGDSAEIFVDGSQVVIVHVFESVPRHHLEKVAVEWLRNAA
jgi:hypothetical protein